MVYYYILPKADVSEIDEKVATFFDLLLLEDESLFSLFDEKNESYYNFYQETLERFDTSSYRYEILEMTTPKEVNKGLYETKILVQTSGVNKDEENTAFPELYIMQFSYIDNDWKIKSIDIKQDTAALLGE